MIENIWQRVIDEELVCAFIGVASDQDNYSEAKRKLNDLICWHIEVATDPRCNGGKILVDEEEWLNLKSKEGI